MNARVQNHLIGCLFLRPPQAGSVLAMQNKYATLDQIRTIKRHAPQTALLEINGSGHFPFLTHTDEVINAIATFAGRK